MFSCTVEPVLKDCLTGNKNMVSQDRLSLVTGSTALNNVEMWDLPPEICGSSRQVESHGSGLSRQVLRYASLVDKAHKPSHVVDPRPVLYWLSSHRPVDVHNLYNQVQVQLLMRDSDLGDKVPPFDAVFREEDVSTVVPLLMATLNRGHSP